MGLKRTNRRLHIAQMADFDLTENSIRRLIVIIWRPLEHISARSSKTMGDKEKKSYGVPRQATRELLFGAIAAAQWSTTRPVEMRVCMYLADWPTKVALIVDQSEPTSIFRLYHTFNREGCFLEISHVIGWNWFLMLC